MRDAGPDRVTISYRKAYCAAISAVESSVRLNFRGFSMTENLFKPGSKGVH